MADFNAITPSFNANDWTGETIAVAYNRETREFGMYGYVFTVTHYTEVHNGSGYVQLLGDDWQDSLATIHCSADDNLERLIIRAAIHVRNYV